VTVGVAGGGSLVKKVGEQEKLSSQARGYLSVPNFYYARRNKKRLQEHASPGGPYISKTEV
jgi:hypothetical protein